MFFYLKSQTLDNSQALFFTSITQERTFAAEKGVKISRHKISFTFCDFHLIQVTLTICVVIIMGVRSHNA